MAGLLNNLTTETAGTEEEAAEGLGAALEIEMEENRGGRGRGRGRGGLKGHWETLSSSVRKPSPPLSASITISSAAPSPSAASSSVPAVSVVKLFRSPATPPLSSSRCEREDRKSVVFTSR